MELELSDDEASDLRDMRDEALDAVESEFEMTERQVSAHYRTTLSLSSRKTKSVMDDIQDQFGVSEEESAAMIQPSVERACQNRFEEDHDLTFSTDYVSADYDGSRWSCTIMTNQT